MRGVLKLGPVIALLLVTLTACGSADEATRYRSVSALQAAFEKAGFACKTTVPVSETAEANATALCPDGTTLAIYSGPEKVASQLSLSRSLNKALGVADVKWVYGANWTVSRATRIDQVATRSGGEVCDG
jgi:hypothetical protein